MSSDSPLHCCSGAVLLSLLLVGLISLSSMDDLEAKPNDLLAIELEKLETPVRRAIEGCLRRLEKSPQSYQRYYELAATVDAHDMMEEAVSNYQEALELKPDHLPSLYNCALNYEYLGRNQEAKNNWDRILETNPDHPATNFRLGEYYLRKGQLEEALACFEIYKSSQPASAIGHSRLGNTLLQLNRIEESLNALEKASKIAPLDRPTLVMISQVHLRAGNRQKAEEIQQRLKDDDSLRDSLVLRDPLRVDVTSRAINSNSCIARAENFDRQGFHASALTQYLLAAQGQPDNPRLIGRIGRALVQLGQNSKAIKQLDRAIAIDDTLVDSYHYRGLAKLQDGNKTEAVIDFMKALELDPDHTPSRQRLEKLGEL